MVPPKNSDFMVLWSLSGKSLSIYNMDQEKLLPTNTTLQFGLHVHNSSITSVWCLTKVYKCNKCRELKHNRVPFLTPFDLLPGDV